MLIVDIWRDQPGKYFCISTKTRDKKWYDKLFRRSQLDEVAEYVRERRDRHVYFCPHGFTARRRLKDYAVAPTLLWADMDVVDPREIELRPTIAIESSPGRYVGLWLTDDVVTEELNRRLSYHVGCDRSGWDLTQVLRLPGTINYKYSGLPRVRLLWDDGPDYRVSDLERQLVQMPERKRQADTGGEAAMAIERRLRWHSARQYMQEAVEGKRSDMIAGLIYTLHEDDYSHDDIVWALMRCPSFIDKRGRDEDRAYAEIDNCLRNKP